MSGYFVVFEHPHGSEHPTDITFQLQRDASGEIPPDQSQLKSEVERTLDVLLAIFQPDDPKFHRYFGELLGLSQYGLVGDTAQPIQAMDTLENLQKRIFDQEKGRAVSGHMHGIIRSQVVLLSAVGIALVGVAFAAGKWLAPELSRQILTLFAVIPGLFVGVVFSSFMRCKTITFYDLHAIEADRFTPVMKGAFAIVTLTKC